MRVLLSASFPNDDDRGNAVKPFSITHIDLATTAIIEQVLLAGATLRFGGHPSISRLVLEVASQWHRGAQVELFQTRFFARDFTEDALDLVAREGANLRLTDAVPATDGRSSMENSLQLMREQMLTVDRIDAAFFVGGMDGLIPEWRLVQRAQADAVMFLLDHPGGQTRLLARGPAGEASNVRVLRGSAYPELVSAALSYLGSEG